MVDSHELQSGSLMLVGVYKLTDCSALYQVNAGELYADLVFDDATLYVNPFMVVTPQGYTKHYYIGSQHIAAQTGYTAFMPNVVVSENNSSEYVQLAQNLLQTQMEMYESSETQEPDEIPYLDIDGQDASELQPLCTDDMQVVEVGYSMTSNRIYSLLSHNYWPDANSDPEIYYYHSDHLGSATWITDFSGAPIQYVHYLPYGETYLNQHGSTYDERYKFTGKERDIETGYDYFGARYYSSVLSSWLSPDPLMDKYPSISPYAYCRWNPIKYVDPDGRDLTLAGLNKSSVTIKSDLVNFNIDISKLNVDFGGTYNFQGDEIFSATLDIVGIFDPSGIADGLNAALQLNNGNVSGAFISAAGLIPYFGDLAKVGKVKKDLGVINTAIETAKLKGTKKTLSQLQREIYTGKAPKGITRLDKGNPKNNEQPHVHFKDGSALNKDGTWKHGKGKLSNEQKQYLKQNGWNIE